MSLFTQKTRLQRMLGGQNDHLDKPPAFQILSYHHSHMFIQPSVLKPVTKEGSAAFLAIYLILKYLHKYFAELLA